MTVGNNSKRRTKFWKQPITNYVDEEEIVKTNSSSSVENSRRESMSSGQGSPIKSSPKKSKEQKSKKSALPNVSVGQDDTMIMCRRTNRKNSKDRNESPRDENRLSAGARLYRVMEEHALGETLRESNENLYSGGSRRRSLCSPGSSPNFRY